jgi:CheY-like chemotaxis protein
MNLLPILVAEDSKDDVYLLRRAFVKARIANPLHIVSDGEEALAYLKSAAPYSDRKKHPFPGLLLLDLKMPRLDGLETLSAIRADPEISRLIVIVLSSSGEAGDVNRAFDLRANSYLVKPGSSDRMVDALAKIKDYWLALNQYPNFSVPLTTPQPA